MSLSRVKSWAAEILTPTDLNAEFNNILNYLNSGTVALATLTVSGTTTLTGALTSPLITGPTKFLNAASDDFAGYVRTQKTTGIAQSSTVDVFRFLDSAGAVTGTFFVSGILMVNLIDEASGVNNSTIMFAVNTTGNGSTNSSIDDFMLYAAGVAGTASIVQRGVQLATSLTLANDAGGSGSVKVQLNTNASGKTVTARVTFIGMVK